MESLPEDLLRHVITMLSLDDTNQRVVTKTSEVDQRPLRVHKCLASWLGACGLVSARLWAITRDAPAWRALCQQAFPMEPSPSRESYARWRVLERDPSEARVITPADLEGCATVLFVLRETDSACEAVRHVLHYERVFLQPKDGDARVDGDRVIHPPDASSLQGGAFFPEGWARVSTNLQERDDGRLVYGELPGLLSGELVLRRADGKLALLSTLDFARTRCDILSGEGDTDGYHLSAYYDEPEEKATDRYWLASFEDEANDTHLELVCILFFHHRGQPLPNAPIQSCWVDEVLFHWAEQEVAVDTDMKVRGLCWR